MLYLLTCRAGLVRSGPDRTGQDWRVLHWDVYKDSGFILNLQKFCKFYSTKFICLKLLVIKKVLNYLEVNMYLLPHFIASMDQTNKKIGRKMSGFLDSPDFETFPDFRTRRDVCQSPTYIVEEAGMSKRCYYVMYG